MITVTLRTDKPEAEVGIYQNNQQLAYQTWQAHRELAETIHTKMHELLKSQAKDWTDIEGLVIYQGPGSFTGLRIGFSVANALAYSYKLPIVAQTGENWLTDGVQNLLAGKADHVILPEYGVEAHITKPTK